MENIFYLFPVREGTNGSYAHPLLQKTSFPQDKDRFICSGLSSVCAIDEELQYASRNIRSFYFSENVSEFCEGMNTGGEYPAPITLIRRKFNKLMTDATGLLPDAGDNCSVYDAHVLGRDYFARIAACNMLGRVEGTMLCALFSDPDNRKIAVKVDDQELALDKRPTDFCSIVDWLAEHHHPSRTYEANPKHYYEHRVKRGEIASEWPYDDATSQSFLNRAFVDGKRLALLVLEESLALLFDEHTKDHYHGHVDNINKINSNVQKLLMRVKTHQESHGE